MKFRSATLTCISSRTPFSRRSRRKAGDPWRNWRACSGGVSAIPAEDLAEAWKSELDKHGVAKAALIASIPGDEDSVAAAVSLYPDRFYGFFMANPTAPDGVDRVRRALAGGRLQGICLFPAMHRYSIQDPRVRPVFEAAAAHPGTSSSYIAGCSPGRAAKIGAAFAIRYALFEPYRPACGGARILQGQLCHPAFRSRLFSRDAHALPTYAPTYIWIHRAPTAGPVTSRSRWI